jgi:hypothetical protein
MLPITCLIHPKAYSLNLKDALYVANHAINTFRPQMPGSCEDALKLTRALLDPAMSLPPPPPPHHHHHHHVKLRSQWPRHKVREDLGNLNLRIFWGI